MSAGDVFEPGVDAVGLGVASVGFDVTSIGTGGSDSVVGVDVDDLAGDDGVLFQTVRMWYLKVVVMKRKEGKNLPG